MCQRVMYLFTHRYVLCVGDGFHLLCVAHSDLWYPQGTAQVGPVSVPRPETHTHVRGRKGIVIYNTSGMQSIVGLADIATPSSNTHARVIQSLQM